MASSQDMPGEYQRVCLHLVWEGERISRTRRSWVEGDGRLLLETELFDIFNGREE